MKEGSERAGPSKRPSRPAPRDGSNLIKAFVQEAEKRRIACRFARTGTGLTPRPPGHRQTHFPPSRPHGRASGEDDRLEVRSGSSTSHRSNQEEDTAVVVGGLFTTKHVQRDRQVSLTPAMLPAAAAAAATGLGVNNKPIFTFTRRKLQMESVNTQGPMTGSIHRATAAMLVNPNSVAVTTSQHLGHRPRVSHLAAKLDAILRTSPWMRRKVIMQPPVTGQSQRGLSTASSRFLSTHSSSVSPLHSHPEGIDVSSGNANEKHQSHRHHRKNGLGSTDEDSGEMEKRIMVTFQRFVRVWRERKRRSEQAAMSIVNGGGSVQQSHAQSPVNLNNGAAGRHAGKLRREIDAQSSNVASILSRRMIGEVPALKFFDEGEPLGLDHAPEAAFAAATAPRMRSFNDEDGEDPLSPGTPKVLPRTLGDLMVSSSSKGGGLRTSPARRATPRGVCYTLDSTGCRRIKMQSGAAVLTSRAGKQPNDHRKNSEELTVERAMSKSLRRKMIRRVKVKRQAIGRLTDDFRRSKDALTAKLGSQLALREAEGERMFGTRLSLLLSDDAELPPHMAAKELALARLRFKKANLQASCQTLALLGGALHHIETAGEVSGLEVSSGEQHFLEILRCAVQGDHAMTPLLVDGILGQFNLEQRQKPLVAGLLALLERAVPAET